MNEQRGTKSDLNRANPPSEAAALGDKIAALIALANELRADGITNKTAADGVETLIEELHDDHALLITVINDIKTLVNNIRATFVGDYLDGDPGLAVGSTAQNVSNLAIGFHINGVEYQLAADAVGIALAGDDIPQNKYGSFRLEVGADGTVDLVAGANNATGFDTAGEAVSDLPALSADHISLGTLTLVKSDAVFDPGTTAISDGSTTDDFIDGLSGQEQISAAVSSSPPAGLGTGKPASSAGAITAPAVDVLPS